MKKYIGSTVRHLITTYGGVLVSSGMIAKDDLQLLAGGLAVLAGLVWSYVNKKFFSK
jgi:hypothetical protein